jgi:hypothetical protein
MTTRVDVMIDVTTCMPPRLHGIVTQTDIHTRALSSHAMMV